MKKLIYLLSLSPVLTFAQPQGYYDDAVGLNGQALKAALHQIIDDHDPIGYSGLWNAFEASDKKNNGKVWDIYSDKPGQTPPYEFTFVTDQCGGNSPNTENGCFNREHTWPQSYFSSSNPAVSDLFHVYPTDAWVNSKRGNFPYGVVNNANWTSLNGSKVGPNAFPGSPSGTAFEPIDSFKGDVARTYFYMATRYYSEDNSWDDWAMADGADLKPWAVSMLLEWHHLDPVSQKEKDRNEAVYSLQDNRNPFIDNPLFADCIWANADCWTNSVAEVADPENLSIYPIPAKGLVRVDWQGAVAEQFVVEVYAVSGARLHHSEPAAKAFHFSVDGWAPGVYLIHIKTPKTRLVKKLIVE